MIMHSNASGLVFQYEYDDYSPRGKVLRNHTNLGENWQFRYFPTFTKVTDSLGREDEYHFDSHHEVIKRIFADGSTVEMERNSLGQLLSQTDSAGRTTAR